MRENFKKHLVVFFSILLVLTTVMNVSSQTATKVQAATYVDMWWNYCKYEGKTATESIISIEKGKKFYIGDYAMLSAEGDFGVASARSGVKYKSSKGSVASVNGKGCVTAKKEGTTKITVSYKNKKITCKLKVVKAGSFPTSDKIRKFNQKADAYAKSMPSKINAKNVFKAYKQMRKYNQFVEELDTSVSPGGFLYIESSQQVTGVKGAGIGYLDNITD